MNIAAHLFDMGEPVLEKGIRTVAVYLGILLLLRLGGKRDLAQLNSFDLVVLLLLSNLVQNAVIGNDNSLVGGLLGAVILVAVNGGVVRLARHSKALTRLFEGDCTVLVRDGRMVESNIRRLGLRDEDVVNALRRQGANTVSEVEKADLAPGGSIVVTLRPEDENATKADIRRVEEKVDLLLARAAS